MVGVHLWGRVVNQSNATKVLAPPMFGRFELRLSWAVVVPVVLAVVVLWRAPRLVERLEWRRLVIGTVVVASAWALSLAAVDGLDALERAARESPRLSIQR